MTVQPAMPVRPPGPPAVPARRADALGVKLLALLLVGAAVSVSLGVYSDAHTASKRTLLGMSIQDMLRLKAVLTVVAFLFVVVQVVSALAMWGKLPSGRWAAPLHRWSGVVAFLVSLPVAFHCLWSLGYQSTTTRVAVHGVVGCALYGAFAAKMLALRLKRLPGWTLPVLGGAVFAAFVALLLTGSVWYFAEDPTS